MASTGKKAWWAGVGAGYVFALTMLTIVLSQGVALGVAYGIWAAAGVAITAILSRIFFHEPLTWLMCIGLLLIVGGVLIIELGPSTDADQGPINRSRASTTSLVGWAGLTTALLLASRRACMTCSPSI